MNATYGQVLDAAAAYSTAADLETLKESYVSSLVLANTTSGWCNLVRGGACRPGQLSAVACCETPVEAWQLHLRQPSPGTVS